MSRARAGAAADYHDEQTSSRKHTRRLKEEDTNRQPIYQFASSAEKGGCGCVAH
jgi:hypothetical protein